ncbi:hypothetical protein [Roseibium sp. SCP14]|uniref:hypothetical protein n=1 Tax=Roseibium sp. SCP14 TaxID=3141375 RepID=UPI0033395EDB
MPEGFKSKGLKSVSGAKPLRSRGFLSQPDGQAVTSETEGDMKKHHRSRGARQATVSTDGKPTDLSVKPAIRPYTLEDE